MLACLHLESSFQIIIRDFTERMLNRIDIRPIFLCFLSIRLDSDKTVCYCKITLLLDASSAGWISVHFWHDNTIPWQLFLQIGSCLWFWPYSHKIFWHVGGTLAQIMTPDRCQAIIWTNAGLLAVGHLRTNLKWNFNRKSYIFIQENMFENVVRKVLAILSWPQCVNSSPPSAAYVSVNRVSLSSDNCLSPIWRQAIIWTNAWLL